MVPRASIRGYEECKRIESCQNQWEKAMYF